MTRRPEGFRLWMNAYGVALPKAYLAMLLVLGALYLWIWLYRLWPRCLGAMVLVKPATVVQWHRSGFRRYWRWRSRCHRPRRPAIDREVRDLIRQTSRTNLL